MVVAYASLLRALFSHSGLFALPQLGHVTTADSMTLDRFAFRPFAMSVVLPLMLSALYSAVYSSADISRNGCSEVDMVFSTFLGWRLLLAIAARSARYLGYALEH